MKRFLLPILFVVYCTFSIASPVAAVVDPLGVPNNRVGVHILDPMEINNAVQLVNSNGGDWGYVTVPMRSNDRDKEKWQAFFNSAKNLHVIPIIRLTTYPVDSVWETPTVYDLIDFANFLDDMPWPTKNRYIIIFNEPNHANEWGGAISPADYATLLVDAKSIFKTRSQDYFILTGGLDMSVPNSNTSMEALRYYQQMTEKDARWFDAIDGLSVHAYPNPGFSASVYSSTRYGITSYRYELATLKKLGFGDKPIFITETGTIVDQSFYSIAFKQIWMEPQIVAITPFILFAGDGPFEKFSLLDKSHQPKKAYKEILELPKVSGSPLLGNVTLSRPPLFSSPEQPNGVNIINSISNFFQRLMSLKSDEKTLQVGSKILTIDVADNFFSRMKGLSGVKSMDVNRGMYFKFDKPGIYPFWMKDMNFALDFIWINNSAVVQINENVLPPSETNNTPTIISPKSSVDAVLEVNAGFVSTNQIKLGDTVK